MMKFIVCEKPNLFRLAEMEAPIAREGEALVRIRRIGVCGTDYHAYRGNQPFFEYPRILGHELSGEIEAIGENSAGLIAGDQVAIIPYLECGECIACRSKKTNCCTSLKVLGVHTDGGMQELISHPISHLIQTNAITLEDSAIVECLSIGAHAVRRAQIKKDEVVLVIGSGPIGLGVMKYANLAGARVIAMDINEKRLRYCQDWASVENTVNAADQPLKELEKITKGDLPTVVFDATGNAASMEASFQFAAHGGRLIFVGLVKSDIRFSDPEFHKKELTLLASRNATRVDFETVIASIEQGKVDTSAFITHQASFENMISSFETWLDPNAGVIKAIVKL